MAEKQFIGVMNSRNKTRVIMVAEGSRTHEAAKKGIGGWSLANPEQEKAYIEKKSSAKSADVDKPTATVEETPSAPEPTDEQPKSVEPKDKPEPTEEPKPKAKGKGGRPKKENS